jgi:hypothetical protein
MAIPKKIAGFGGGKMSKDIVSAIKIRKEQCRIMSLFYGMNKNSTLIPCRGLPRLTAKKMAACHGLRRLYAVYTEGGIYLDTDVYALKRFDDFLSYDYFTSLEQEDNTTIFENVINSNWDDIHHVGNVAFQSGLFGGIKGQLFLKDYKIETIKDGQIINDIFEKYVAKVWELEKARENNFVYHIRRCFVIILKKILPVLPRCLAPF